MSEMNMAPPAQKSKKGLYILLGALGLGIALATGGYFALRGLFTASQVSAEAMPPTTELYVSLDVINSLDVDNLKRIRSVFGDLMDDIADDAPQEDPVASLDETLNEQFGITFSEDIKPWVGRSIGFGVIEIDLEEAGNEAAPDNFIVAIEARDKKDADKFVDKIVANMEADGQTVSAETYKKITYHQFQAKGDNYAIARSQSLVLITSSAEAMLQAIDAQNGDSLISADGYEKAIASLPAERAASLYINTSLVSRAFDIAAVEEQAVPPETLAQLRTQLEAYQGVGLSVTLADAGIQFDASISLDASKLSAAQKDLVAIYADFEPQSAALMPADTVLYYVIPGIGNMTDLLNEQLKLLGEDDVAEAMEIADEMLGFSVLDDFLPLLTGETVFALYPSAQDEQGLGVSPVPFGVMYLNGIEDAAAIDNITEKLSTVIAEQAGFPPEKSEVDGRSTYTVGIFGEEILAYGHDDAYFYVATSGEDFQALFADGEKLADSDSYKSAVKALPSDSVLAFYVDPPAALALAEAADAPLDAEAIDVIEKIPFIVVGQQSGEGGTHTTIVVGLDTE